MDAIRFSLLAVLFLGICGLCAEETQADVTDHHEPEWTVHTSASSTSSVISADGNYITTSLDNEVYFFNKESNNPIWSFTSLDSIYSIAISANGGYAVAGDGYQGWWDNNGKIYLFGKDNGEPIWSRTFNDTVLSVAISADGHYVAAGVGNGNIYLYYVSNGTAIWSYNSGYHGISALAFSTNGEYLVAGTQGDMIYLFGTASESYLKWWQVGDRIHSLDITAGGKYIVAGSGDEYVYLLDRDNWTPRWSYRTGGSVASVAISANNGQYIAAGSYDNKVYLIDRVSGEPLWGYNTGSGVRSVSITDNGDYLTATGFSDTVYLFENTGSSWPSSNSWSYSMGSNHDGTSVDISADHKYVVATDSLGEIYLFLNNELPSFTIHSIPSSPVRVGNELTFSASGSDSDGTILFYNWYSNIDGILSWEPTFSTSNLSAGNHTIFFTVDDDNYGVSGTLFSLIVNPNEPPVVAIYTIESQYLGAEHTYFTSTDSWMSVLPISEVGATLTFSGNASDSDGTIVAYLWTASIDGTDKCDVHVVDFSNCIILSTEEDFTIVNNLSLGDHNITFNAQDNDGSWSVVDLTIRVDSVPLAFAGDDITIEPGYSVQFGGAGTDEDGTIVKYEWDFNGDGIYEWSSSTDGIYTYTYDNEGTYNAVLRVTDNDGHTATDSRKITVEDEGITVIPGPSLIAALGVLLAVARRRI